MAKDWIDVVVDLAEQTQGANTLNEMANKAPGAIASIVNQREALANENEWKQKEWTQTETLISNQKEQNDWNNEYNILKEIHNMSSGAEKEAALLAFTPETTKGQQMHASMMGGNKVYKSNVDSIKKRLKQNERGLNSNGQSFDSAEEQEEDLAVILGDASVYGLSDMFKGEANKLAIGNRRVAELEEGIFMDIVKGDTEEEKKKNARALKQTLLANLDGDTKEAALKNILQPYKEFDIGKGNNLQSVVSAMSMFNQTDATGAFLFPAKVREPMNKIFTDYLGIDYEKLSTADNKTFVPEEMNFPYTYSGHNKQFKHDVVIGGKLKRNTPMQFISVANDERGTIIDTETLIEMSRAQYPNRWKQGDKGEVEILQHLLEAGHIKQHIPQTQKIYTETSN